LSEGYDSRNGVLQPATISNLAAYFVRDDAMPDFLEDKYSISQLGNSVDREVYEYLKTNTSNLLRGYYGTFLVSKETVVKRENNHLLLRDGYESREDIEVTGYTLTRRGEEKIDYLQSYFEEMTEAADESSKTFSRDRIRFPEETRIGWEMQKMSVPRVIDGTDVETGATLEVFR